MAEHYFSEEADIHRGAPAGHRKRLQGRRLALQSATGVFAAGRVDKGTAVLFRYAEPSAASRIFLDLGCGYGVIACAIASVVPAADVWAVDVNERALDLQPRDNAASLGLAGRVHPVPPVNLPAGLWFDEIWSNPPIHVGKPALHDLLGRWLSRLTPGGRAVLVVGRNLGADSLQRWIDGEGFSCVRLGSANGFRVLEARP